MDVCADNSVKVYAYTERLVSILHRYDVTTRLYCTYTSARFIAPKSRDIARGREKITGAMIIVGLKKDFSKNADGESPQRDRDYTYTTGSLLAVG